jgi:hypothetical protein
MAGETSRQNGRKGGRPRGSLSRDTLNKAEAREAARVVILRHLDELLSAQIEHAKGIKHMILRGPDGTFARATDPKQIDAALAAGATFYYIFTKDPSVQAFSDLLNRALDKPAQHVEMSGPDAGPIVVKWKD